MRPVQHTVELGFIYHVLLQCGEEDLASVAEHNDPEGNGEGEDVNAQGNLREGPVPSTQTTIT